MKPVAGSRCELLVDDAVLAYIEWREECASVRECDRRWRGATPENAVRVHAAYQAALDREEAAAGAYAERLARVGNLFHGSEARSTRRTPQARRLNPL